MQVLTVAPLAVGIPYEELSYFGKDDVMPGDLVEITVKRRICRALVLDAQKAEEERQSLRHASFGLKKITKVLIKEFLHPKLWKSLSFASSYLITPLGTIIYDLLSEKSFDLLTPVTVPDVKLFGDSRGKHKETSQHIPRHGTAMKPVILGNKISHMRNGKTKVIIRCVIFKR